MRKKSATFTPGHSAGSESSNPLIQADGASKAFGETLALKSVSFRAYAGEIHAVVGENGSGKSTLVKLLSGVLLPDSGVVSVDGRHYKSPRHALELGVTTVFQEVLVAEASSVARNIFMGQGHFLFGKSRKSERTKLSKKIMMDLTGCKIDVEQPVSSLPLAMKQWVTIARALARVPRILILDESTAALDHQASERLFTVMKKLASQGTAVIFVSHRIAELSEICDRVTVMRDGENVAELSGPGITPVQLLSLMSDQSEASSQKINELKTNRPLVSPAGLGVPAIEARAVKVTADAPSVDLRAEACEILGFAGLEGQGQAEFIRALGCNDSLFSGEIRLSGKHGVLLPDSIRSAAQAGIAYVSGDRKKEGIFPFLSIFENFAASLFRRESGKVLIRRRALLSAFGEHAKHLGLRFGQSDDLITTLSGGNQQKVLLSQAIAKDPIVILLNDPSRGVDIKTKNVLKDLLREMRDSGKVVIFLSSEIEELVEVCDKIAVFRNGGIDSWLEGTEISTETVLSAMFGQANDKEFTTSQGQET